MKAFILNNNAITNMEKLTCPNCYELIDIDCIAVHLRGEE